MLWLFFAASGLQWQAVEEIAMDRRTPTRQAHSGARPAPYPPRRRAFSLLLALGMLALAVLACSKPTPEPRPEAREAAALQGQPAPSFKLPTLDKKTIALNDLRGRPVALNFWTTSCTGCKEEMAGLQTAYETYGKAGLALLAINVQETSEEVSAYVEENNLTFPILMDNKAKVSNQYRVADFPTTYLIDRKGQITAVHVGKLSGADIDRLLSAHVAPEEEAPSGIKFPTPRPSATTALDRLEGCVAGAYALNIRIGPSTDYSLAVGDGLEKGDCLVFDGRSEDADLVRIAPGYPIRPNQTGVPSQTGPPDPTGVPTQTGDRLWVSSYYIDFKGEINALPVVETKP